MQEQSNLPQPLVAAEPDLPIGAKMTRAEMWGIILVTLFAVLFIVPGLGWLGVPILIIAMLAAARAFKDAAQVSQNAKNVVTIFKFIATVAISLVILVVGIIGYFIYMVSVGGLHI